MTGMRKGSESTEFTKGWGRGLPRLVQTARHGDPAMFSRATPPISFLRMFRHFFGPSAGTVQHAQNPHGIARDAIGDDVGRAENYQLSRAFDAARTAAPWALRQGVDFRLDAPVHCDCSPWIIGSDVVEDLIAVVLREEGPLQLHGLHWTIAPYSCAVRPVAAWRSALSLSCAGSRGVDRSGLPALWRGTMRRVRRCVGSIRMGARLRWPSASTGCELRRRR